MPEANRNLWAPWRMEYLKQSARPSRKPDCFLCDYAAHPARDARNFVLQRSRDVLVLLNRYPYSNGHVMVAPLAHAAALDTLPDAVLLEMSQRIADAQRILRKIVKAQGFNIGMNVGACAGAGLPDHLHWHVVPRWNGDTNYTGIIGDVRVVPQALSETFAAYRTALSKLHPESNNARRNPKAR